MARPIKKGLDYFPLDVHEDSKTEALIRKYGLSGFGLLISLYKEIYKEGYFLKIEGDFIEDLCLKMGVEEPFFSDALSFMVKRSFFDYDLFNDENILTSRGIQKRFLEATKRRKCIQLPIHNLINVNNNSVNADNNSINDNIGTQSKVKEIKVKEIKEKIHAQDWLDEELFYSFLDVRRESFNVKESLSSKSVQLLLNELSDCKSLANKALSMAIKQNSKSFTWALSGLKDQPQQNEVSNIYPI